MMAHSNKRVLVHIGFHKTASSWLQREVFSREEMGFYPLGGGQALEDWVYPDPYSFDSRLLVEKYTPLLADARDSVPFISHERFSGYPASGGYDRKRIAGRFADVFGGLPYNVKILIVIREQVSIIASWYKQYIRDGGTLSFTKALVSPPGPLPMARVPQHSLGFWKYDQCITLYHALFREKNVLVLPYELLRDDVVEFVRKLQSHVGQDHKIVAFGNTVHPSMSVLSLSPLKLYTRYFHVNQLSPEALVDLGNARKLAVGTGMVLDRVIPRRLRKDADRHLMKKVASLVGDTFAASNRSTEELTGLDLKGYGYSV